MRRCLFIFLLVVVPLQLVWAAAAPYCGHESGGALGKHFGHHEHQHQADGDAAPDVAGGGPDDVDCASCQLASAATFPMQPVLIDASLDAIAPPGLVPGHALHSPAGPERPDRSETTPAARFGGGDAFGSIVS